MLTNRIIIGGVGGVGDDDGGYVDTITNQFNWKIRGGLRACGLRVILLTSTSVLVRALCAERTDSQPEHLGDFREWGCVSKMCQLSSVAYERDEREAFEVRGLLGTDHHKRAVCIHNSYSIDIQYWVKWQFAL